MLTLFGSGGSIRHNVDGILFTSGQPAARYGQVFRNGCLEIVETYAEDNATRAALPSQAFESDIFKQIAGSEKIFGTIGINPPVVVMVTLLGMKGWQMEARPGISSGRRPETFDRDPLFIPELLLEVNSGKPTHLARPLLDMVWNSAGWSRSPNYNDAGEWDPQRW